MQNPISARHDAAQASLPNTAALRLRLGRARLRADAAFSSTGLLALAGLLAATRKLPAGAMPAGMKRRR